MPSLPFLSGSSLLSRRVPALVTASKSMAHVRDEAMAMATLPLRRNANPTLTLTLKPRLTPNPNPIPTINPNPILNHTATPSLTLNQTPTLIPTPTSTPTLNLNSIPTQNPTLTLTPTPTLELTPTLNPIQTPTLTRTRTRTRKRTRIATKMLTPILTPNPNPNPIVTVTPNSTDSLTLVLDKTLTPGSACARRSLNPEFDSLLVNPDNNSWTTLGVDSSELSLPLTLPTGQTFRWKGTPTPSEYTGVVGPHLISLRHHHQHNAASSEVVQFRIHNVDSGSGPFKDAISSLRDYLNLDISLSEMWATFEVADKRFAALSPYLRGARLLRQSPLECLFQFICSSNNHIQRITQMVDYLTSLGPHLGNVNGHSFHAFPSLERLSLVSESELRNAGFGYRAKYIVGTVEELCSKEGGGEQWLLSLRMKSLEEAVEALCSLPGVGPKVAACVALFSLDQHHAIPVDTHVWQIATRYLTPELAGQRLTPKLHDAVSSAFVERFGKYAGWAQTVLFIADLSSYQALLPDHLRVNKAKGAATKRKRKDKEEF